MRIADELWLPQVAKALADGTTVTELVTADMRERIRTPPDRELTFGRWPQAPAWLQANCPAWRAWAAAIGAVIAGLASEAYIEEYLGVALWLALTRQPDDRSQQQRLIAGFLLLLASTAAAGDWQERYLDSRALLRAVTGTLEQLPPPAATPRAE
jgi:hypothetical protein